MRFLFLLVMPAILVGCIDNPILPDFIHLPFEGSGQSTQIVRENEAVILEVEGRCSGYEVGSRWISDYEFFFERIGIGDGIDGNAGTDSRPCLRYRVARSEVSLFCDTVFACAEDAGIWKVYISEVMDSGELKSIAIFP